MKTNGKLDRSPLVSFASDDSEHDESSQKLPDIFIVDQPFSRSSSPVAAMLSSVASVIRCWEILLIQCCQKITLTFHVLSFVRM